MKRPGFSLVELVVVIAIIAILTTLAYPTYQKLITRSRRIDGQTALLDLARRMEDYFAENQTYEGATLGTGASTDLLRNNHSSEGWYLLKIIKQTQHSFSLQAIPIKAQALNDKSCQLLGLNHLGMKTAGHATETTTGIEDCW